MADQVLPSATSDQALWAAIRNRSQAIQFERYQAFIQRVFCDDEDISTGCNTIAGKGGLLEAKDVLSRIGYGAKAYQTLKAATEAFLLLNTGVYIHRGLSDAGFNYPGYPSASRAAGGSAPTSGQSNGATTTDACATVECRDMANLGSSSALLKDGLPMDKNPADEDYKTESDPHELERMPKQAEGSDGSPRFLDVNTLKELLTTYLSDTSTILPYLHRIAQTLYDNPTESYGGPLCSGLLQRQLQCPLMIELIWNYWHEAGGQVQTMKAIARRFQNRRQCDANDPLADLDIDPLRAVGHILWGYIQDEHNQLTVLRRVYEYDHHYGISLKGKAIPRMCAADSRSKFLAGFHNLLRVALAYYKTAEDTERIPDGFPLLNNLKEVHLLLAESAGNQFGELPYQSRVEMLMEQWILARNEMREFLRGRVMVPYPADFMGRVDTMRRLQGWGDTSIRYFYDLAIFGERLLLSVRYGDWSTVTSENAAKNWANYWREEVQGYVHAYRVVTDVDLSDTGSESTTLQRIVTPPQELIRGTRTSAGAAANGVMVS